LDILYGLVKTSTSDKDQKILVRGHQCTLCNYTANKYGNLTRLFLNNDSVFLSMLISAQMKEHIVPEQVRCKIIGNHHKSNDTYEFLGAVAVMTGKSKALDAYYDSNALLPKISLSLLKKQFREAKKVLQEQGFPYAVFESGISRQHLIERESTDPDLDELHIPTSKIISTILGHTADLTGMEENRPVLSEIGYDLGALIYALDCYSDIEEDRLADKFNPFLLCESVPGDAWRSPEVTLKTIDFCNEKLFRIKENTSKLKLRRYGMQIIETLTTNLERRVYGSMLKALSPQPTHGMTYAHLMIPASMAFLKFMVTNGEGDGDLYDCCVWCSDGECGCEGEGGVDPVQAMADEVVTIATQGGAAAAVAGGAAIVGGKILRGRRKPPEVGKVPKDTFVSPEANRELVPPDDVQIVEIPDELPEVPRLNMDDSNKDIPPPPEIDQSKHMDTTMDPSVKDPDKGLPDTPPEITKPEYPEDIYDGVKAGGNFDWLFDAMKKVRKFDPPPLDDAGRKRLNITDEQWKESVWTKAWRNFRKAADDYYNTTSEERARRDKAAAAGGKIAKENPAFGGGSNGVKALSKPVGFDQTGEGDPKTMLEQAMMDYNAKNATTGVRMFRAVEKMFRSTFRTIVPKTRVPPMENLGVPDMKNKPLFNAAKEIGKKVVRVFDPSGLSEGILDGISQTNLNIITDVISPDSTVIAERTGYYQADPAQQEAIKQFLKTKGMLPRHDNPSDVREWTRIYREIK